MLLAHAFDRPGLLARIRRFRASALRVYGAVLALVAAATLLRLALPQPLATALPLGGYGLAVLGMALAGGFWPGMATMLASALAGAILVLPPPFGLALTHGSGWTLLMFVLAGSVAVALVSGLMAAILQQDEHRQALFGELQHRARNLFTLVQSIAARTLQESQTLPQAGEAMRSRLAALARAHAMLADSGWTGAPLNQIVAQELTGFADRITCVGCGLALNTPAAQTFALIVHELAANAVKHGALSRPQGHIYILGQAQRDEGGALFQFNWTETGADMTAPPERQGFGSSVLNHMARQFASHVDTSYRPEGLIYELRVPLAAIRAPEGRWQRKPAAALYPPPPPAIVAD